MNNDNTTALSKVSGVSTLPDYLMNQQQALRNISGDTVQAGIRFMDMFSAMVQQGTDQTAMQMLQLLPDPGESLPATETADTLATPQPAVKDSPQPQTGTATPDVKDKSPALAVDPTSEVRQALDMLVVDEDQLTAKDIKLMQLLVHLPPTTGLANQNNPSGKQLPFLHYRSMGFSKGLTEALEQAYKTQRPVRIDLDNASAVILRLGKNGKVSAEFLPGDPAAQLYFSQNLQDLKNRLESKNLPYGELSVRDQRQDNQQQKRRQDQQQG